MKKRFLSFITLGLLLWSGIKADNTYGLPESIQDGNILQCFNWPLKTIKENLEDIASAGYGAVQVSPLQRADVQSNWHWYDLYCPYDIALKESSALGSRADLKDLCSVADKYGIKVIVDVVANHINWTSGYYNTWWTENNRNRNGRSQSLIGSNYNDRKNITQNRLGDYFEVNSESQEVIDRAVAYVKDLASCGVKGIRWDAAKHIALPSESQGGPFWAEVTSCVPGMYHYGEILDDPCNGQPALIKEYAKYMSVTDNRYSNVAARNNGGIPTGANGNWVNNQGLGAEKLVYWAESHDTYSNDEWSQNVDQLIINRAYAAIACRKGSTALYLARPSQKGFGNIQIKKGTDAYKAHSLKQVNKFRNIMGDRSDYFSNNGNACSITRQNGGAVIVMKGSGEVSVSNGAGYCPPGTYTDRVSGGTFTVTSSTISGTVGYTGITVIYPESLGAFDPIPEDNLGSGDESVKPTSEAIVPEGRFAIFVKANQSPYLWAWSGSTNFFSNWPGEKMNLACKGSDGITYYYWVVPEGYSQVNCIFSFNGDTDKTKDITNITKNTYFVYTGEAGSLPSAQEVPSSITITTGNETITPDPGNDGDSDDEGDKGDEENPGDNGDPENKDEDDNSGNNGENNTDQPDDSGDSDNNEDDGNGGNAEEPVNPGEGNDNGDSGNTDDPGNEDNNGNEDDNGNEENPGDNGDVNGDDNPDNGDDDGNEENSGDNGSEGENNPSDDTGIEGIYGPEIEITISQGEISVVGCNGQNMILVNMEGRVLYNVKANGDMVLTVTPGFYILHIDGKSQKLIVR